MVIDTQVVFLTQKWRARTEDFRAALAVLNQTAFGDEKVWVSVGERQNEPWLFITIRRARKVAAPSNWTVTPETGASYRYERSYEGSDPTPGAVARDISGILRAPEMP
jgi:hypothetical protein